MGSSAYKSYAIPGHLLKTHPLYAAIVNADVLINVPIAKQHGSTGLTLAGKNMMGCTSNRGRMHTLGLSQSIAEINAKLRPELTVIDAMRILVRNGPSGGSLGDVKVKNTVIACKDWVAADTYATRLFGKTPGDVPYIKAAADMGLGSTMNLSASSPSATCGPSRTASWSRGRTRREGAPAGRMDRREGRAGSAAARARAAGKPPAGCAAPSRSRSSSSSSTCCSRRCSAAPRSPTPTSSSASTRWRRFAHDAGRPPVAAAPGAGARHRRARGRGRAASGAAGSARWGRCSAGSASARRGG